MSVIDKDILIAPWVGPTCYKNSLSIVVVSSNIDIIENISEALIEVHDRVNLRWKLAVLRCFNLEDIVRQSDVTGKMDIDFVIIAMDSSRISCIEWVKNVLDHVHPDLRIRRTVLVNASGLPINAMAVNTSEVICFCKENRLDMLNANALKKDETKSLAQRLLNYIEVSIGSKTGLPNINV
ncbi:uncharacterized protein LOC119832996 [Zerene cesonia]|uniref:uncharacterized protein LOC119832996 n=1 Tax=Zerene cesonia TaxID=33412 RepID=UPI0018E4FF7E|nr:uncharacterized protein LOC119832996 [Zerene cesonia]